MRNYLLEKTTRRNSRVQQLGYDCNVTATSRKSKELKTRENAMDIKLN